MTLEDAVEAIGEIVPIVERDLPAELFDITSGGKRERKGDVSEPGLFASQALAISFWQRAVLDFAKDRKATGIVLVDGPHLDRFETTMMDKNRTQRVAEPRWSVSATIGIVAD